MTTTDQQRYRLPFQDASLIWDSDNRLWHLVAPVGPTDGGPLCDTWDPPVGVEIPAGSALHCLTCEACKARPEWRDVLGSMRAWADNQLRQLP
jgi:hypothetical protein